MDDEDFLVITPFNPDDGIWFKSGGIYLDRDRQITAFEKVIGCQLPEDFLEMIDEYCVGIFDGYYRVYLVNDVEVQWHGLLLMRLADGYEAYPQDVLRLIHATPDLFGNLGNLNLFPFGEAYVLSGTDDMVHGYLTFDLRRQDEIVFISKNGEMRIDVAPSFRQMMLGSSRVCFT